MANSRDDDLASYYDDVPPHDSQPFPQSAPEQMVTDIAGIESFEQFDYIVCHGVCSWVSVTVQDAIFRICLRGGL